MPTAGRYLLDTNVVIALLGGEPRIVRRVASRVRVYLPSIALGELYYGAYRSQRPKANIQRNSRDT